VGYLPKFNSIFFCKEPLRLAHQKNKRLIVDIQHSQNGFILENLENFPVAHKFQIWANVIRQSLWDKSVMVLGASYNTKQKQKKK
jgi:hypothetical protein